MSFLERTLHLLVPRSSNNHRAKALHLSSLSFYIVALLVFQIGLTTIGRYYPSVLSYASNINISDLLSETNIRRQQSAVGPVQLNDQLSDAARRKAANMFAEQYWAHISPSGKDPWSFISAAGYNFLFAGENLARDFGDSKSVVDAWMNSPGHRDNLLNSRYKDVGFAVANGKYGDHETTLVVQMFGTRPNTPATIDAPETQVKSDQAPAPGESSPIKESSPSPTPAPPQSPPADTKTPGLILKTEDSGIKIDPLQLTRNISLALIGFLLLVMVIDAVVAYKNKPIRSTGHNFAHMLFLLALLVVMTILSKTGLTL
jgi:uncharacterized protein YkwD